MKYVFSDSKEFIELSTKVIAQVRHATVFYTDLERCYQRHYLADRIVKDLSFFVLQDTQECGAFVPLYLCSTEGRLEFSYGGDYLRAPLFFVPETAGARLRIEAAVFEKIDELAKKEGVSLHKAAVEPYEAVSRVTLYNYLRKYGYQDTSTSTQIIDLEQEREAIWLAVRKSYRPLINRAKEKYQDLVMDESQPDLRIFEEYRKLHHLAAGRQTRPLETFQKMYELITQGLAFLVGITDGTQKWVGAYYYFRFNGHVYYSSSALHPEADSKDGISHFGVWRAIEYAKSRQDRVFELGWQPFAEEPEYSEKVNNIAMFKRGFGGQRVIWFQGVKHFGVRTGGL